MLNDFVDDFNQSDSGTIDVARDVAGYHVELAHRCFVRCEGVVRLIRLGSLNRDGFLVGEGINKTA